MKIICFGDSNTWGYDPRDYFGRAYDEIWPSLLEKKSGWTVINWGENGREIPTARVLLPEDTELLIVMLGTNDLLRFQEPGIVCDRMESFLRSLSIAGNKILLVAPPHMHRGTWVTDQKLISASALLSAQLRTTALHLGVMFADAEEWNVSIAYDGVHFSEYGHHIFAEGIYKHLLGELGLCCRNV